MGWKPHVSSGVVYGGGNIDFDGDSVVCWTGLTPSQFHSCKNNIYPAGRLVSSSSGFCSDPQEVHGTLVLSGGVSYSISFSGSLSSGSSDVKIGDVTAADAPDATGNVTCTITMYKGPSRHKVFYDNHASFPPDTSYYPTNGQEFDEDEDFWLSVTAPEGWRLTGVTRNSNPIEVPPGGAISFDHQDAMGTDDIHFTLEFTQLDDWAKGLRFVGISSSGKAYTHDFVASGEEAWNAWPILDYVDNDAETPINTAILRSTDGKALAPGVYRLHVDADPDPGVFSEVSVPVGNGAKSIGFPLGTGIPYSKLGGYWEIVYEAEEEKGVPGPLTDPYPVTPDEPPAPPPEEPDEEVEYLPTPEIPELPDPEIPELPTLSGTCNDPCLCDIAGLLQCLCSRLSCLDQHLVQVGNLVANGLYSHGVAVVGGFNRVGENVDQVRSSLEEGVLDLVGAVGSLQDGVVDELQGIVGGVESLQTGILDGLSEFEDSFNVAGENFVESLDGVKDAVQGIADVGPIEVSVETDDVLINGEPALRRR